MSCMLAAKREERRGREVTIIHPRPMPQTFATYQVNEWKKVQSNRLLFSIVSVKMYAL